MRLLHVIHSVNPAGGGPIEWIWQLAAIHSQAGHDVSVACLDSPRAPWLGRNPIPVFALGPGIFKYGWTPKFVPWLREYSENVDAVVAHGLWQYGSFGVWRVLRNGAIPYFVLPQGMLDPWFKRRYPLKHLKKLLYWPWAEYRVLRDARAVLFTAEEEMLQARKSFRPYRCRERVVPMGITPPQGDAAHFREAFFKQYPQLAGKRLILFLGRIHEKKGCDLLLRAFAEVAPQYPDLHLIMAGPDQVGWQGRLQEMCATHGISGRVTWPGMLTGDLKWGALYAAEVFALISFQENFGLAVVEALACGTPVLISYAINIWREIAAADAGFVEAPGQEGACRLLKRWLETGDSNRSTMRSNARRCFEKHFDAGRAAELFLQTLNECGVGTRISKNEPIKR